jgi:hypothetical protein
MDREGSRWPPVGRDAGWIVHDVLIEGVSLVANCRAQCHRIIWGSSYWELGARLKARERGSAGMPQQFLRKGGHTCVALSWV